LRNLNKMKKCLVCQRKNIGNLCEECLKNPFRTEDYRRILAEKGELQLLKKVYTSSFPEIKDINTPQMWNETFKTIGNIKDQDGMTKDRVKTAYKFLPSTCNKILDIGAGAGFIEEYLIRNKNIQIYANDFSDISIEKLKKKFKGNFEKQSIYNLKYPNNFFDCIFILEILEHIPPSKVFTVLRDVKKILCRNGSLIVSVPMNEVLEKMKDNPNGHVRDYTYPLIKAELELTGFKIIESKELYAFKNFYLAKKILSRLFKNRWKPNNIVIKAQLT